MSDLYDAATRGDLELVQKHVERGANIEKPTGNWTPLLIASYNGHVEVTHYLLKKGANKDKVDNLGLTSLHLAANGGHLETAKLLMVYGADLDVREKGCGCLAIEVTTSEEMKDAIRDEPRRRLANGHKGRVNE